MRKRGCRVEPGIHVIRNGELKVEDGGSLSGSGVHADLHGKRFRQDCRSSTDSTISMTAPATGVSAGILLYAVPSSKQREFRNESKNAGLFTGTVYLPTIASSSGETANGDGNL